MSNRRILFIHVPKTGGTSLTAWIADHFPKQARLPLDWTYGTLPPGQSEAEWIDERTAQIDHYDLVAQHLPYQWWQRLRRGRVSLAVLREPRARLISYYRMHLLQNSDAMKQLGGVDLELHDLAKGGIEAFFGSGHRSIENFSRNGQTRQLGGLRRPRDGDPDGLGAERTGWVPDLDAALQTIRELDVVGVVEMLMPTALLLCRQTGWPPPTDLPQHGRAPGSSDDVEPTPEERRLLDEFTRLDRVLYRAALQRFSCDLAEVMTDTARWSPPAADSGGQVRSDVPMSTDALGSGWHVREGAERNLRWTGPQRQSTLELTLETRTDHEVRIHLAGFMAPDILQGVHVLAASESLPVSIRTEDGHRTIVAELSRRQIESSGRVRLSILVPFTRSHRDLDPENPDDRQKGLLVSRIEARPA